MARTRPGDDFLLVDKLNCVRVAEWTPPNGTAPTQVHMLFDVPGAPLVVVRFRAAEDVDQVISALQEHRRGVWGEPKGRLADVVPGAGLGGAGGGGGHS